MDNHQSTFTIYDEWDYIEELAKKDNALLGRLKDHATYKAFFFDAPEGWVWDWIKGYHKEIELSDLGKLQFLLRNNLDSRV